MKNRAKRSFHSPTQRGFALIVTLSLMILLTVIAVGLLSLSSISLRASSQSNAMATAQANARLGLMLAIGDLQAAAGLDQRVTAPGGVLGATTDQQRVTGVWKSKKQGPGSKPTDFDASEKSNEFVRWLVSGSDADQKNSEFAKSSPGTGNDIVEFVTSASANGGASLLRAKKMPLKGAGANATTTTGNYAYAVMDEGAKARINLGVSKPTTDLAGTSSALGRGQRPSIDSIPGVGKLDATEVDLSTESGRALTSKMISVPTAEFAFNSGFEKMRPKIHDFTTNSMGVLADVANGGLKRDFNLLAEETEKTGKVPPEYDGVGIYRQTFSEAVVSDPSWSRAISWSRIFGERSRTVLSNRTVGGVSIPSLTASAPTGWVAGTGKKSSTSASGSATLSLIDPPGNVILPSIARVQMSFALAARDIYKNVTNGVPAQWAGKKTGLNEPLHDAWARRFQRNVNIKLLPEDDTDDKKDARQGFDSPYDFLLHMVYSPLVTLHNPYNVPLACSNLRVEFVNTPFAFRVFVKDGITGAVKPQTDRPVPFSLMYQQSMAGGQSKRFGFTIASVVLHPGEVKVFSPDIPSTRTWDEEVRNVRTTDAAGNAVNQVFWDHGNKNDEDGRAGGTATDTSRAVGIPGWNGAKVGYDLDFLAPAGYVTEAELTLPTGEKIDRWHGIPLKKTDQVYVESTPLQDPNLPEKKFSIEMTLNYSPGAVNRSSSLLFEFANPADLQESVMKNNPQAQSDNPNVIRTPEGSDAWPVVDKLWDPASRSLAGMANVQAFALFSASAKTTSGASDPNGEEGQWAAKPFSFQDQRSPAFSQTLTKDGSKGHPSHFSHDITLTRFPENGLSLQKPTNRGLFVTGATSTRGVRLAGLYDVPLAPLQSFSSLNGAQLAAGAYLPHFSAPIGNSYAHPLMSGSAALESGPAGHIYADHSFLLNAALYDRYFFSGLQTRSSKVRFGDGKIRDTLVDEFLDSGDPQKSVQSPLTDQNLKPFLADGTTKTAVANILRGNEAYKKAAAYKVVEGAFNVNSISKDAWKAVLSSMTGEGAEALVLPASSTTDTKITRAPLNPRSDAKGARFSRFRTPSGQADRTTSDGILRGPVDLTPDELDRLAEEVVKQVQKRGPFLSLSEFVNRQLGPAEEKTLSGALQKAIDDSQVNAVATGKLPGNFNIGSQQTAGLKLKNPKALEGDSIQGAPGYLTQSDVLAVLGNSATVRSDTFKIRSYGDAVDKSGKVIARAYCEAIVQRTPEFVDPQDKADIEISDLTSAANEKFGRRFSILSVRWLSPSEI